MALKKLLPLQFVVSFFFMGLQAQPNQITNAGLRPPIAVLSQTKFIAGDTAWFKLYLLNEYNKRVSGKNWVRVDIIDNHSISRHHGIFAINDGLGFGQLKLPIDLQPGHYLFTTCQYEIEIPRPPLSKTEIMVVSSNFLMISKRVEKYVSSDRVAINLKQKQIRSRDQVFVEIRLLDSLQRPITGEFSISVKNDSLLGLNHDAKTADLIFTSSPKLLQKTSASSNRIWQGIAYNTVSKERLLDSTKIYLYLQKSGWRYQTVLGIGGRIKLPIPDFENQDEFFYLAEINGVISSDVNIDWETPVVDWPTARNISSGEAIDRYAVYAEKKSLVDKSYGFYSGLDKEIVSDVKTKSMLDQVPISIVIKIADYDLFPTMTEYIKEVIPSIYVRRRDEKNIVRVKLQSLTASTPPSLANNDPIYFIDGVATHNTDFFLSLKPAELISIKIANESRKLGPFGLLGKNGIVIVQTKRGHMRDGQADPTRLLNGIQKPMSFNHVIHLNDNKRNPDFRAVLYWNPSMRTDKNGNAEFEFYSSDDIGKYNIEVTGFSDNGEFFSSYAFFKVSR